MRSNDRFAYDLGRGPRKSLFAFWGALQVVAIVVNHTSRVFSLDSLDLTSEASRSMNKVIQNS